MIIHCRCAKRVCSFKKILRTFNILYFFCYIKCFKSSLESTCIINTNSNNLGWGWEHPVGGGGIVALYSISRWYSN